MNKFAPKFVSLLLVTITACGGASMQSSSMSPRASARPEYQSPVVRSESTNATNEPSPAAQRGAEKDDEYKSSNDKSAVPDPATRPGLGTEWGETRESRLHYTQFERSNGDQPFAIASIFYNDWPGIKALINYHGTGNPEGSYHEYSALQGQVRIWLFDESRRPLDGFRYGDRTYVAGEAGSRYTIIANNQSAHRLEIVTTVDGLDVINGSTGTYSNRGYILEPHNSLEIEGFRQNQNAVAAFRFGRVADSYAAHSDSGQGGRNVGVIGFAIFTERGDRVEDDTPTRDNANPFPDSRFAPPPR